MYQDGRSSQAIVALLERARELKARGLAVSVVAYDMKGMDGNARQEAMARLILDERAKAPRSLVLVLSGNVQARTVRGAAWDEELVPMGALLLEAEPGGRSLDAQYSGLTARCSKCLKILHFRGTTARRRRKACVVSIRPGVVRRLPEGGRSRPFQAGRTSRTEEEQAMRVMVMVKATKNSEAGVMPGEDLLTAMGRFNEELVKAGIMLAGDGLHPSRKGKRVRFSGGKKIVIDGPFAETKELVAGFWIWQVKSMEEAIEWVRRCPDPMPGEESEIEIRRIFEPEDFGKEFTPELRTQAERVYEETCGSGSSQHARTEST